MLKVRVTKGAPRNIKGVSAKSGKPYDLYIQTAYAYVTDRETGEIVEIPDKFEIVLPDGDPHGYGPGTYILSPASFFVDRNGRLAVNPVLIRPEQAGAATPPSVSK